jgi:hypothetical protein
VFGAFPEFVAFMRVFIIRSSYLLDCWGRSLANTLERWHLGSSVSRMVRIPAWGVGNLGSNPSDPTTKKPCSKQELGLV